MVLHSQLTTKPAKTIKTAGQLEGRTSLDWTGLWITEFCLQVWKHDIVVSKQ